MGRSGIASANFLAGRKAQVTLIDHKERKDLEEAIAQLNPSVQINFGADALPGNEELVIRESIAILPFWNQPGDAVSPFGVKSSWPAGSPPLLSSQLQGPMGNRPAQR